ncbi:3-hydroxyacyl-CoA dehydrogenase NAD-binding domain-containing protein [soil metagenome]
MYRHWKIESDQEQIQWASLNKEGSSTNTLDIEVLNELERILDEVSTATEIRGLVITSSKESGFIAGADLRVFQQNGGLEGFEDKLKELLTRGHTVTNKLAALKIPTVALISGYCLGGGLELALACRYRICENTPKTRLGLPEVLLGIHPGWGGTVRLPRLIGAIEGLKLIITGQSVPAKKALKLGIVDEALAKRQLHDAARHYILKQPPVHKTSLVQALSNYALVRPLLAKQFYRKLHEKLSPKHYPAPYAVIQNWLTHGVDSNEALAAELNSFTNFYHNSTTQNLIRLFFLQEQLKEIAKKASPQSKSLPTPKHIHVIGAGVMGSDIAAWCAVQGFHVTLQDREPELLAKGIKRAYALFQKKLKEPLLIQAAMDRLIPDVLGLGIAEADIIIEAIFENLEVKRTLLLAIENKMKADAILATNTSSILLEEIAEVLKHPQRLVGLHFFNPVAKMKLVEIVVGNSTSPAIAQRACRFVGLLDRLPLPVKSQPGFLVNRVLAPYLLEGTLLLEEGFPATTIDKAATDFGMPLGPLALADTIGLDICLSVANNLRAAYGWDIPRTLTELVAQGHLGKKTGKGFYLYKNNKPIKITSSEYQSVKGKDTEVPTSNLNNVAVGTADICDRLLLRLCNEAIACLREKVIADSDLADAGLVFGAGFAPFRGGPIQYIRTTGIELLHNRLIALQQQYGDRFKPDQAWEGIF